MHYQSTILSTLMLLFVTQAYSANLMCYVCDDCAKISADTPLLACNAGYFNPTGTTASSTGTTETSPTTTEMSDITTDPTTEPTTVTVITESTASTEKPMPTPPTVGPVETTSAMPTPPEEDLIAMEGAPVLLNATQQVVTTLLPVSGTSSSTSTTTTTTTTSTTSAPVATENDTTTSTEVPSSTNASEFSIRQVRSVVDTDVTYHCFSVQKNVNGSQITQRGCSSVTTMEAVCTQLQATNEGVKLSKCNPCSISKCNGSSALSVSFLTLIIAAVAGFLSRN